MNKRDRALLPDHIRCGREILGDLAAAERREWWLTNGRGGYAAGTLAGTLTRRYHGLLIATIHPPLGRELVFAKADAMLVDGARETPLHTNRWGGGVIHPEGHRHTESFRLDGRMPVWRFAVDGHVIEQRIWMEPGADTTYIAWKLDTRPEPRATALRLGVNLLVNARDHHGEMTAGGFAPTIAADEMRLTVELPSGQTLHLRAQRGGIEARNHWVENFDLPVEHERGLPGHDNHLCVGQATLELLPGEWVGVIGSLHEDASPYLEEAMTRFHAQDVAVIKRARALTPEAVGAPDWIRQLLLAADGFVFSRPLADLADGESVIAGYPWFGDWGRDTMIALPGLTLPTGRYASARRILATFARFVDQGMLPNWFPGTGDTPEYNTADAALWFIEAWRAYLEVTGDWDTLRPAWSVLVSIIDAYSAGTRYGIAVDPADGLLAAGAPGVQVTWMDAKVGERVITPRIGKAVELNALWHNALQAMAWMAGRLGEAPALFTASADRARAGFARFVRPDGGGLYDVIDAPEGNDATVRPNQILAASLQYSPLDQSAQEAVLAACGGQLLTSYGLRSLAPGHPDYHGRYAGGPAARDASYHQGPAWAWLLGHYAMAEFRVHGDSDAALRRLQPVADHLADAGLGTVSEIFDGDPPHQPRGAPSQAWSVACTLEAWWRIGRARRAPSRRDFAC